MTQPRLHTPACAICMGDVTVVVYTCIGDQHHRSVSMIRRWCPRLLLFVFYLYSLRFATLHATDSGSGAVCQECPNGSFADQSNENCSNCEGGYCNGIEYCSLCLPGTHTEHSGMSVCEECETGSVCNETGCDKCTKCLAGTAAKDSRVCNLCNIGSYSDKDGSTSCKECSKGYVCNTTGCTHCIPCSAGHQPQSRTSLYFCEPCPPGKYRSSSAYYPSLFCSPCQQGWYQSKEGQISCLECPEGHFCPDSTSNPRKCPEGTNCPPGSWQPILCHNLYSYSNEARECVPQSSFYITIVSVIAIFILIIVLVAVAMYWNIFRKKQMKEEKVPLVVKKQPIKDPMYYGH